eukprot:TRINITY_DN2206_c0_g1_i6.p1 TRINITY_DN2206_c0_g1~~TRINITY_DN2206_c0_g1_i6.p1  ORF type:complete len:293 (+),score=24.95 TRINITY_DN2206_c0_g1_i6:253-1131(+)
MALATGERSNHGESVLPTVWAGEGSAAAFFRSFERGAGLMRFPPAAWTEMFKLGSYVSGPAKAWYEVAAQRRNADYALASIKAELVRLFDQGRDAIFGEALKKKFDARRQQAGERSVAYVGDKMDMAQKLAAIDSNMSPAGSLLALTRSNLLPEIQLAIISQQATTFEALLELAHGAERVLVNTGRWHTSSTGSMWQEPTVLAAGNTATPMVDVDVAAVGRRVNAPITCWTCGRGGHRECPSGQRPGGSATTATTSPQWQRRGVAGGKHHGLLQLRHGWPQLARMPPGTWRQ